jgi:magnesium chelatase subunit I
VLIGTMNPEEGELRPQLLDRFGFNVALSGQTLPAERGQIIRRRLDFDSDPTAFCAQWAEPQAPCASAAPRRGHGWTALRWMIRLWRRSASAVLPPASMACVPTWSGCAAPEPMRHGAASAIAEEDIEAVAEFALRHRRQEHSPPANPPSQGQPPAVGHLAGPGPMGRHARAEPAHRRAPRRAELAKSPRHPPST